MADGITTQRHLWQPELHVAIEAATAAGNLIRAGFSERSKGVEDKKNTSDLVTATDLKVTVCLFAHSLQTACIRHTQCLRQRKCVHTHVLKLTHRHTPIKLCYTTHSTTQSEEIVFSRIRGAFPDHLLIGEESSASGSCVGDSLTDAPTWMCGGCDLRAETRN